MVFCVFQCFLRFPGLFDNLWTVCMIVPTNNGTSMSFFLISSAYKQIINMLGTFLINMDHIYRFREVEKFITP